MRRNKRILRKSKNNWLAGVAAGTAEFIGWQPRAIRSAWVLATIFIGLLVLIVYAICAFTFPPPDDFDINDFRAQ